MSSDRPLPPAQLNWFRVNGRKREQLGNERLDKGGSWVIGRDPNCDICLAEDEFCSNVHAAIKCELLGYELVDRRSTNGTWLNNVRMDSAWLRHGDNFVIGNTLFTLDAPSLGTTTPKSQPRQMPVEMVGVGPKHQALAQALRELDAEESGRLRRLPSGVLLARLEEMLAVDERTVRRWSADLAETLHVASATAYRRNFRDLLQDLVNRLVGRTEDPPHSSCSTGKTSEWGNLSG